MDTNNHLNSFNSWYNQYESAINKDLRELKSITNAEEKHQKAKKYFSKHSTVEENLRVHFNNGNLQSISGCSGKYHDYSRKVHQIKKIRDENKKNNRAEQNIVEVSYQPVSDNNLNNENGSQEYINCQQCFKEIKAGNTYWYHKSKNDNHKFCSPTCYQEYYGEYCSKCVSENKNYTKYLNLIHDKDNSYCSTCYQLVKQEQPEQEWNPTIYCRYCSTKTELFEVCEKKECLEKMNQEIEDKKNNNPQERKENISSEQKQLQSQITNLENKPNKTKAEQTELERKKKELEELLKRKDNSNSSKPSDKTSIYVGCGVVGIVLIFSIFIIARIRKKNKNKY